MTVFAGQALVYAAGEPLRVFSPVAKEDLWPGKLRSLSRGFRLCLGIAWLTYAAPRRPRLAQLAFLVVAAFLVFSKVWSQQYVLWLLPLALLARPRWGAFFAWQVAEVCYFFAFNGELMRASGSPIFPEGVFILAALLRLVTLAVFCGFVIRDIMRPELDVVRHSYPDDPDGGVLDGALDRWSGGPSLVSTPAAGSAELLTE